MTERARRDYQAAGWCRLAASPDMRDWIAAATPAAEAALADPAHAHWYRHRRSWFVGVHALDNDGQGRIAGGPPLPRPVFDLLAALALPRLPLDRGQVSACFPGYPRQDDGESDAAHRFRRDRDAAHVDGLHGIGTPKRRFLREAHGWLLGIPLQAVTAGMAPFVIWEGSQRIMARAFRAVLGQVAADRWRDIDVTEAYQEARREVFATCPRREITAEPGDAYLVHRLALHGVAPWREGAAAAPCRSIIYFRPELDDLADWLNLP